MVSERDNPLRTPSLTLSIFSPIYLLSITLETSSIPCTRGIPLDSIVDRVLLNFDAAILILVFFITGSLSFHLSNSCLPNSDLPKYLKPVNSPEAANTYTYHRRMIVWLTANNILVGSGSRIPLLSNICIKPGSTAIIMNSTTAVATPASTMG